MSSLLLPLFNLAGETVYFLHPRKIGGHGNAFADRRQFSGQLLARLGAACGDVNLYAIFNVSPGDHFTETTTAAGDDRDLAAHREQLFDFHFSLLIIGGGRPARYSPKTACAAYIEAIEKANEVALNSIKACDRKSHAIAARPVRSQPPYGRVGLR